MLPHELFEQLRRNVTEAIASGDADTAVAIVRPAARSVAAEQGAAFRDLIGELPESAWHSDPIIASAMGVSFRAAGSPRGASAIGYFDAAEAGLADAPRDHDPARVAVWLGHAAALRGAGRLDQALAYVERARGLDGSGGVLSVPVRVELGARSTLEHGMLELQLGNVDSARRLFEFAHGLENHLTRAERVECLGGLAIVEYVQANLDAAVGHVAEARALTDGTTLLASDFAAPALVAEALVAIDRHELDHAAETEPELVTAASGNDWEPFAHVVAGYLRLARRHLAEGLDFLQRARQCYRTWEPPGLGQGVEELLRASILVALDQGDEAWSILRDLPPYEHHLLCPARITALLRFGHGDLQGAVEAMQECEVLGEDHSPRTMVEVRLLRAAIEFERAEYPLSDVMMDRALVSMARTGSRAPLRAIPPGTLGGLTARALTRTHSAEVTGILLRIADVTTGSDRLIEPLSHRELLVLAEVEKGSTVVGIAAALYISPNTVKTHLRRLYRKLGVTTRADAIRKAKSLGLGHQITRGSPVPRDANPGYR